MKKYHYFYKITNNVNGKYYYGVHSTDNLDDGYMGSGTLLKYSFRKYGKKNFTKEILHYFDSAEELFDFEREFVNEETINDPNCYNIAVGGSGGYVTAGYTFEQKKEHANKIKIGQQNSEKFKHRDLSYTPERRQNLSNKFSGKNNPMYGKNCEDFMTPEAIIEKRKKLSESMKGRHFSEEHRRNMSKSHKGFSGYHHSAESKKKIKDNHAHLSGEKHPMYGRTGDKNPMYGKNPEDFMTSEAIKVKRKKQSEAVKCNKNNFGKTWMNNGIKQTLVKKQDIQIYLKNGYVFGRYK